MPTFAGPAVPVVAPRLVHQQRVRVEIFVAHARVFPRAARANTRAPWSARTAGARPGHSTAPCRTTTEMSASAACVAAVHTLRFDAQVDAVVQLREFRQPRQQHLAREVRRHVQAHARAAETRAQLLGDGFQPREQIVDLLEITRTGVGERECASATRKQRQAELRFQRLDLVAHRRRRDAELIGGDGEARMSGGDLKGLDGLQ